MNVPKAVQASIVSAIETLDILLDAIPSVEFEVTQRSNGYFNFVTRICRYGGWGCLLGVANLSSRLDDRWDTGVWQKVKPFQVSYTTPSLTSEQLQMIREEFLPEYRVDVLSSPSSVRVTWVERAVDAQAALREAREAIALTGLTPRLRAFTFPREIVE